MAAAIGPRQTFPGIGRCIYCGSTTADLRDEHIIPYSLWGEFVMLKASCQQCANVTSAFERDCARGIYRELRVFHQYPTRRPRERPTHMPVRIECNDVIEERMIPISEYPGAPLFAPIFPRPGILVGRPPSEEIPDIRYQVLMPAPPDHEERLKKLRGDGPTKVHIEILWNLNPVMCMLAKIGHGLAVVTYGDLFTPILPDYILDRDRKLAHVIGSTDQTIERLPHEKDRLGAHAFRVGVREVGGVRYASVVLHFLRYLELPHYEIIAGPIPAENVQAALAREAPQRAKT
jgi:hypothetical protein